MSESRDDQAKRAWDNWTEEDVTTEVAYLRRLLRMAEERAAIACRERDEAMALNQAMSRVLADKKKDER